jgi:hypothetical protein
MYLLIAKASAYFEGKFLTKIILTNDRVISPEFQLIESN